MKQILKKYIFKTAPQNKKIPKSRLECPAKYLLLNRTPATQFLINMSGKKQKKQITNAIKTGGRYWPFLTIIKWCRIYGAKWTCAWVTQHHTLINARGLRSYTDTAHQYKPDSTTAIAQTFWGGSATEVKMWMRCCRCCCCKWR